MHWTQIAGIATAAAIAQMIRFWWARKTEAIDPLRLRRIDRLLDMSSGFLLGWVTAVLAFTTIAGWRN